MSVINTAAINFAINGEAIDSVLLNRALLQTINQINAHDFGSSYTQGSGISIVGTSISVDGTVLRTTGSFTIGGLWTFSDIVSAVGFNTTSDKRLKNEQSDLVINDKSKIKLKEWVWADSEYVPASLRGKKDSGVIADDVEKEFPSCVNVNEHGIKMVDYGKLAVHLILSKGE